MVEIETNREFVKRGNVVILKENIPDIEMTDKDVMSNISYIESELDRAKQQLEQLESNKEKLLKTIERGTVSLKQFNKFYDWAVEAQKSKIRVLVEENLEKCLNYVDETYKYDETLTLEQNKRQKYAILQRKLATLPEVNETVSPNMIKQFFFETPLFSNPWIITDEDKQ